MPCADPAAHRPHTWPDEGTGAHTWYCPGVRPSPFATLLYSWEELEELARLVDAALSEQYIAGTERAMMLNSLRTSLREAQYQLRTG